jgi:hypothetical protein
MQAALFAAADSPPPEAGMATDPAAAAAAAPSPVEGQPWRIEDDGRRIVVRLVGERTDAALLAAGAAIGNLVLALTLEGVKCRWLPGEGDILAVVQRN